MENLATQAFTIHVCMCAMVSHWLSRSSGNADRHHYETFQADGNNGRLLHLDNGKGYVWVYMCCLHV